MPRTSRRTIPDVTYHLIARFVDRHWFITSEHERSKYLGFLGAALGKSTWRCLGYAVMSNHIHLAVIASEQPLADWIRSPHSAFADWMNRTHDRIGNVFTRGPKSIHVPDSRVGHLLAYIHNNPVRANVVAAAAESTWTSHRYYVGTRERRPRWLHVSEGRRLAGHTNRSDFDRFVRSNPAHPVLGPVESDEEFWEKLEEYEQHQIELFERPRAAQVNSLAIVHVAAEESGVTLAQLRSARRGLAEQRTRAAVVICGARLGISTPELARCLHLTRQAVSKILHRGEVPAPVEELVARMQERVPGPQ